MRMLRKPLLAGALAAAAFGAVQSAPADDQPAREYVVVYESDAAKAAARDAVADAGGSIVKENAAIGVATVRSSDADFARKATAEGALVGAAANKPIGTGEPGGKKKEIPGEKRSARRGQGRQGQEGRAARRQPVGHAHDRRHAGAVLPHPAGLAAGARRHPRHGRRRVASGHPAELREVALAQLHHGHARHRRALRGRAGPVLLGRGRHRRGRPRHARGGHRRRGAQRHRHRGRGPEDRHREPARRPGLGLLLPAAVGGRPDVRGRPRDRRREHELLHRSVALQLRRQPGRHAGAAGGAARDHRRPRSARCATRTTAA